jgi:transcriptional regulator with XRE-family HTH domain
MLPYKRNGKHPLSDLPRALRKNGDVPKSPLPINRSLMPSVGTFSIWKSTWFASPPPAEPAFLHKSPVASATRSSGVSMPHPIDLMVGKRVRLRRLQLSLSQTDLGQKLGVAFQQVQKYEKGANRVSCSRLYEISQVLDVPVTYFFSESGDAGIEVAVIEPFDVPELKEGFRLMTAFKQIQNSAVRKIVIVLAEALAAASQVDAKKPFANQTAAAVSP